MPDIDDATLGSLLITEFDGLALSDDLRTLLAEGLVSGVLLFARNIASRAQTQALTAAICMAGAPNRPAPLIAIDHEGGPVNRLRGVLGERPAPTELGARASRKHAAGGSIQAFADIYATGAQAADDLATLGITLNFAPTVDLVDDASGEARNPALKQRTFGADPLLVTDCARAYLTGLQADGWVIGCLKHFPGLGATDRDPHQRLPTLRRTQAEIMRDELAPYRTLIAGRQALHHLDGQPMEEQPLVACAMVTHLLAPALDPDAVATFSPSIVSGLLRDELAFSGVVVSDSLRMGAVARQTPLPEACVLAAQAGCDLLLGPRTPTEARACHAALRQALSEGRLDAEQVAASARRICALKARLA
ncbi:MAG TPA: glycoside hydrolase family 3 N-terminal domain-containing protein [Ktedonobacterales bacterium]|nr:glycoside hydrolase family 3 N-terminal domain-containing protein [Ktedonobacterales bacterium]